MSCRVMNRHVEHGLLSELAALARAHGCTTLLGDYFPTARNGMVSNLYSSLGFTEIGAVGDNGTRFRLDLMNTKLDWPAAIRRNLIK
jgi:predicted enzyme involved in methoxymalonyl-ACP biosynthesis